MLNEKHNAASAEKVKHMQAVYAPYEYKMLRGLKTEFALADKFYNKFPEHLKTREIKPGEAWGKDFDYGWFRVKIEIDAGWGAGLVV